jgi:outer membrane murein-binding lipoprotein Lpp
MKRFNWLVVGLVVLCLAMISLAGCVSKSEYEALQADYDTLNADNDTLQADYDELNANYAAVEAELADIQQVYPPRDFSSLSELTDWLLQNDVSERPLATTAENLYSKALEIQEDALKDGYIVSADFDYDENVDLFYISCVTIINGDTWYWDPETDEPIQYYYWGKVK